MTYKKWLIVAVMLVCTGVAISVATLTPMIGNAQTPNFPPPHLAAFTPTGQATISATTTSANVALPTLGTSSPIATTVIVTNEDASATAFVLLGTSNAVAVTVTTGMPIPPHGQVSLAIGANTFIAAIGSAAATVGITTGR